MKKIEKSKRLVVNITQVISGPYNSVKMIEKDYSALKQINFDEVDIKLNE